MKTWLSAVGKNVTEIGLFSHLFKLSQKLSEKDSWSNNIVKFVDLFRSVWSCLRTAHVNNHHRWWASQSLFSCVSWVSWESMFWSAAQNPCVWWPACHGVSSSGHDCRGILCQYWDWVQQLYHYQAYQISLLCLCFSNVLLKGGSQNMHAREVGFVLVMNHSLQRIYVFWEGASILK